MAKTKSNNDERDEEIFGAASLLDRVSKGKTIADRAVTKEGTDSNDTKALKRQSVNGAESRSQTVRITVYMNPNDLNELDQQVIETRRRTGKKKDRSTLINEAVRLWLEEQG